MTGNNSLKLIVLIVCLSCFVFSDLSAQSKEENCKRVKDTILNKFIYTQADNLPQPEGGIEALGKSLEKEVRFLPSDVEYGGRVIVAFVVEIDGKIDGGRTIRDPSGKANIFGKQILKAVKEIKWKPAKCNSKPVPFLYTVPVSIHPQE